MVCLYLIGGTKSSLPLYNLHDEEIVPEQTAHLICATLSFSCVRLTYTSTVVYNIMQIKNLVIAVDCPSSSSQNVSASVEGPLLRQHPTFSFNIYFDDFSTRTQPLLYLLYVIITQPRLDAIGAGMTEYVTSIGGRDIKKICRRYPKPTKLSPISVENLSD
jgi:hypothetical protein